MSIKVKNNRIIFLVDIETLQDFISKGLRQSAKRFSREER